jgi:cytochrome P450
MIDPLRPSAPVAPRFDSHLNAWVLSRYADVITALEDRKLKAATPDGEAHARMRDSAIAWLSSVRLPAACAQWDVPETLRVDLMRDVAEPWCLKVAAAVARLPLEAARELIPLTYDIFQAAAGPPHPERQRKGLDATAELLKTFKGDDGALNLQAFVALSQTLPRFLTNSWLAFLLHPEQMQILRETSRQMPTAIEELLRYAGPAAVQFRTGYHDPDDRVMLMVASANRDPAHFKDPDVLNLTRTPLRHLAFGHGVHACIGAALIRTTASSAMSMFVTRFPRAEIVECKVSQDLAIRSLETLIV